VQYNCGLPVRVPDTFPEDAVTTASLKDPRIEWLDNRISHQVIMAPPPGMKVLVGVLAAIGVWETLATSGAPGPKYLASVAAAFWPVFVNVVYGVRRNRVEYREKAQALKMNRWRFYRQVVVPASAPMIASGTRAAIGLPMAATIAVELVVGYGGGLVLNAEQTNDTPLIYAGVIVGGADGWLAGC
jgi:ABC-type proline/glycine betaine transport system permease subunit